jgi:hypothetical protein
MERKLDQLIPHERKDKVSTIHIEPEKPYGIYLPDWNGLVHAINTFARSEYQSTAPIPRSHIIFESELRRRGNPPSKGYKHYTQEELKDYANFTGDPANQTEIDLALEAVKAHLKKGDKLQLDDKHENRGSVQLSKDGKNEFFIGGRTFYKTGVTIEALRSEKQKNSGNLDLRTYTEPYLLNIYSELNNENPEAVLLQAIDAEQAVLPRRMQVLLHPEGYTGINTRELANRLNDTLHNEDEAKLDRLKVFAAFTNPKGSLLGVYDGLELTMRSYSTRHLENPSQRQVGVEFIIADSTLESRIYGKTNLIPPEKRQAAQALAEKVHNAFI